MFAFYSWSKTKFPTFVIITVPIKVMFDLLKSIQNI